MKKTLILTFLVAVWIPQAFAGKLPKYGPDAVPLSAKSNVEYFRKNAAPDFWALMPFYVGQRNDSSCSAATLTTVLNAVRRNDNLKQDDELVTEKSLVEKFADDRYAYQVSGDAALALKHGFVKLGVSVERLAEILKTAVNKLGISNKDTDIKLQVIDQSDLKQSKKIFHDLLVKNEKSNQDFILLNFTQGILTGDAGGMVGHIAAVGAYDQTKHLVLILDPDRQWYEPYWSPENKVFEAISDKRSDAHPGYVYFRAK